MQDLVFILGVRSELSLENEFGGHPVPVKSDAVGMAVNIHVGVFTDWVDGLASRIFISFSMARRNVGKSQLSVPCSRARFFLISVGSLLIMIDTSRAP